MGFKKTSEMLTISTALPQSAPDAFTQKIVELPLNALDQEIFVVTSARIDFGNYVDDPAAVGNSELLISITSTSQTAVQGISNSRTIAAAARRVSLCTNGVGGSETHVPWEDNPVDTPPANMEYIAIIATPDFFVQIDSDNLLLASSANVRIYGYRAKADAATYAALVQNELISA